MRDSIIIFVIFVILGSIFWGFLHYMKNRKQLRTKRHILEGLVDEFQEELRIFRETCREEYFVERWIKNVKLDEVCHNLSRSYKSESLINKKIQEIEKKISLLHSCMANKKTYLEKKNSKPIPELAQSEEIVFTNGLVPLDEDEVDELEFEFELAQEEDRFFSIFKADDDEYEEDFEEDDPDQLAERSDIDCINPGDLDDPSDYVSMTEVQEAVESDDVLRLEDGDWVIFEENK